MSDTTADAGERVTVRLDGGVADVRLNRPEKRNAIDPAMFAALVRTGERLKTEPGLRAVVLSGEGPDFCAGLDFDSFRAMRTGERLSAAAQLPPSDGPAKAAGQRAAYVWAELPVPVIAAVHGVAFGGGFQLALGADMRFLSVDARMSIMEIKWGLVPDMAGTPILVSLVRDDILRELTYTGRIFSAQEAAGYGLATRVCDDPRAAAFELAREIAGRSPGAIRAAKRLLNNLSVDPAAALLAESMEQMKLMGSPNQLEAVRANIEKRPPHFADV